MKVYAWTYKGSGRNVDSVSELAQFEEIGVVK
jgi:hypothetical protein